MATDVARLGVVGNQDVGVEADNHRALKWTVSNSICLKQETIEHLFFQCSIAKNRWKDIRHFRRGMVLQATVQATFSLAMDLVQQKKTRNSHSHCRSVQLC